MTHVTIDQAMQMALKHHQSGRKSEAEGIYRQILQAVPQHAGALNCLGILEGGAGNHDMAIALISKAIIVCPTVGEYHSNLGEFYRRAKKMDLAVESLKRAVELKPDSPEARYNLGIVLQAMGRVEEAVAAYREAVRLKPQFADAHCNLGVALREQGEMEEAMGAIRQALVINPNLSTAHYNRGSILAAEGKYDEAVGAYQRAISLRADYADAYSNLATTFKDQGRVEEAVTAYDRAIAIQGDNPVYRSNRLFTLYYHPRCDTAALLEHHREGGRAFAKMAPQGSVPHSNDRTAGRRIRVGYVSPDLRDHAVGRNILPLFRERDREAFDIFCYSNSRLSDAITEQFKKHADGWRSIVNVSDEAVAGQIRDDRIDILVDLSLHTAGNRLPVFARKPAPVQVCFAGYPGSTGLEAIDYRLTDPYLDPAGPEGATDGDYVEKSVRLPRSFWCYDPAAMMSGMANPPAVSSLPALEKRFITFGCLNNFCKVNEGVLRLWAKVLRSVDGSKLMLLIPEGSQRERTLQVLRAEGIKMDRIEFVGRQSRGAYLELYHRIDIGLDTLPYNGHTTSLDSYWMGVPVVTLVGKTVVGRAGWSQLSNLGMTELAAKTPEEYVRIVSELAGDRERLKRMRAELRGRMEQSPLSDAKGFVRGVEGALRQMWQNWCGNGGGGA